MREKNIRLRPISLNDTNNIVKWRNTDSVKQNLFTRDDITHEDHIKWFNNYVMKGLCSQFIIEIIEPSMDIGTVFIKNIDKKNDKGEFGIFIGEEEARGKGFGKTATKLILDHAFTELNLNRVYLSVFVDNLSGIKSYANAGFEQEGVLRQDYKYGNKYYDVLLMSILRHKWMEMKG
ncbi:MAG TPA: UDP-4-amino-4,6-dideoxy-N-acetyl-beta-L-altrosamine N-acetyltransferase [Proteiniclasticum sp.]|uniref:GNAT family N-acetyltransferase n=1 Tax=Proteiniclasticum sp. TaxID=2053595 RepID=UPI000E9FEF7A|nr:GNAT family protein [Proteiniclasticum sp.]HBW13303.1 UDP-4-amino-4,6-dideoxy-N-acetyl-beta-L-altrosamine N-acetyltransferase [Proteiniclasticum sp.]